MLELARGGEVEISAEQQAQALRAVLRLDGNTIDRHRLGAAFVGARRSGRQTVVWGTRCTQARINPLVANSCSAWPTPVLSTSCQPSCPTAKLPPDTPRRSRPDMPILARDARAGKWPPAFPRLGAGQTITAAMRMTRR